MARALLGTYRFFHQKKVGLVLILALGAMALIGVLLPQVGPDLSADAASYQSFLEEQRHTFGGWTAIFSFLQFFSMFSSPAFTVVTTLLALSIIACTVHRLPLLWEQATKPRTHVAARFFERARLRDTLEVALPPEEALEHARGLLQKSRFRVLPDSRNEQGLFADRNRFAPLGTVAAHLAFVIILIGVLLSGATGFREDQFTVAVGSERDVGHATGLSVEVLSFADTYHPDGRPLDYVSEVILREHGAQVARQELRVNTPLRHNGVKFNQAYFGVAADLHVATADGEVLLDRGVPLEWTTEDGTLDYSKFRLDEPDLLVYVVAPASGHPHPEIGAGQLRVEIYPGDEDVPIANEVIDQGKPTQVADLMVTFEREQKYTGLMVSRDNGAVWVWVGSLLLLFGTYFTMVRRHHRVWVRVEPHGSSSLVRVGCADRIDLSFDRQFRKLARELAEPGSTKEG